MIHCNDLNLRTFRALIMGTPCCTQAYGFVETVWPCHHEDKTRWAHMPIRVRPWTKLNRLQAY